MRTNLGATIRRLSQLRALSEAQRPAATRLREVSGFGANPGGLAMLQYLPPTISADRALVVVLHGCTQSAEGYARGAGWIEAADRHGFALLCPEQSRRNNPNTCFNWFVSEDIQRGRGEAASIAQMIVHMTTAHNLDPARVYVTGLSAGGAMANVMLATYPELFRGGAIIAGLPYASAGNVQEAFAAMAHQRDASDIVLGARIRAAAAAHNGPWPTVSVWHGEMDATVAPAAGEAIVRQWVNVHGARPGGHQRFGPRRRTTWTNQAGDVVVEHHVIAEMGHGTPLQIESDDAVGAAGPYLLDVAVPSTLEILASWGLTASRASAPREAPQVRQPSTTRPPPAAPGIYRPAVDVGAVINNALRTAGLLR